MSLLKETRDYLVRLLLKQLQMQMHHRMIMSMNNKDDTSTPNTPHARAGDYLQKFIVPAEVGHQAPH